MAAIDWIVTFGGENLFGIVSWTIRVGALLVVPFRRSAAEARTWLLAFFIAPIPALLLYLAIGRPRHAQKRRALFAKLPQVMQRAIDKSDIMPRVEQSEAKTDDTGLATLATNMSRLPPLTSNAVELLDEYDATIDRLVADIDAAQQHVHLTFYIFANDDTGGKVMDAISRAETRGVECRVLIDAIGSLGFGRKTQRRLERAGIEVHRILPLTRRWTASRIDLRNHRKIAVIDGRIGYTGSQNIVDAEVSSGFEKRELMCRLRGPVVAELQAVFLGDWYLETETELDAPHIFNVEVNAGEAILQVLPTGPDYENGRMDMIFTEMIYSATKQIVLATPYFIPNEAILQALTVAALRGVDVTLILSHKLDSWIVGHAQRSYYAELMQAGVAIKLFGPGFLHAKHLRIDHRVALIGSSNMDMRSFELNAEISLLAYGNAIAGELERQETKLEKKCQDLKLAEWKNRGIGRKVLENTLRLTSDLL